MIAVSLNVGGGVRLIKLQNCARHNEDGRTAPGVCGNGSVPLSHSGNVVTRTGIHTHSGKWLLKFHPKKCKTMRIGRSKVESYNYKLRDELNPVMKTREEKDIGVIIDDKLSFEKHISEKVNTANSIMGVIRRAFQYLDSTTFKTLYT